MLSSHGRVVTDALFGPLARALVRLGVSPNVVTVVASGLALLAALWLLPAGHFVLGPPVVACFVLADSIDGLMARQLGRFSTWGAFLDSTVDRVTDAAIFSGVLLWAMRVEEQLVVIGALLCLVLGSIVPYAKARAEGLGMRIVGGVAERADRVALVLVAIFAVGLGAPVVVLAVALGLLALASLITIAQRVVAVRRQSHGNSPGKVEG